MPGIRRAWVYKNGFRKKNIATMRIINKHVSRPVKILLGLFPFLVLIVTYGIASHLRRLENPADKLLPSLQAMFRSFARMAFEADKRTGDYLLWTDTLDSLVRLTAGMGISTALTLFFGIAIGFVPHIRATLSPFISSFSLIPPITILPILFLTLGLGEPAKIALIVVGTAPVMIRAIAQSTIAIPKELIIKAETLGASVWQIALRLVVPQIMPKLITTVRLGLVPAWIFLISAEAIASTSGLGYRIFLVRRFLAMDVILPYVAWITLIAFLIDRLLLLFSKRFFSWHHITQESL